MAISQITNKISSNANNNTNRTNNSETSKTAKETSKNGVEEYKNNHSEADSTFHFYDSNEENFNLEEYKTSLQHTSSAILKGYDQDNDGNVTTEEFTDGLMSDFSLDMIEHNAKDDGEPENAEDAVFGAYRASDMVSTVLANIDYYNDGDSDTISVEELSTVLEYADVYGYHDVDGSSFMAADNNGHGNISRSALLSLYDYFTDGGTSNFEAGKNYRNGKDLTEEEASEVTYIMANGIEAMAQQALFFDIDLSQNSKYTDFE